MNEYRILQVFLVLGIVLTAVLAYSQTNLFVKQPGTSFKKQISVPYSGTEDTEIVLIKAKRSQKTPSAMDWLKFENDQQFTYVSVKKGETKFVNAIIHIPQNIDSGRYYIIYEVDNKSGVKTKEISFFVR